VLGDHDAFMGNMSRNILQERTCVSDAMHRSEWNTNKAEYKSGFFGPALLRAPIA